MFKFLDKKRKDAKYKKAGAAHTLGSEKTVTPATNASTPQPHGRPKTARSDAECAAAAAALARFGGAGQGSAKPKSAAGKAPLRGALQADVMGDRELENLQMQAKMMRKASAPLCMATRPS